MCDQNQYKNEFELEREARIAANRRKLAELDLLQAADAFKQAV
jgi:hypothetical protein